MSGAVKLQKIQEWSLQEGINVILAEGADLKPLARIEQEALTYS
jgi:hypothetical protein